MASVLCNKKRPTQLVRGPGKIGKKLPANPSRINKKLKLNNKISIV
jgi:hypothetical protein